MQLENRLHNFVENISDVRVVLHVNCIDEVHKFDALDVLHQQVAHLSLGSIRFRPRNIRFKLEVTWNRRTVQRLHELKFRSGIRDYFLLLVLALGFEDFHCKSLVSGVLNELDCRASSSAYCFNDGVVTNCFWL